MNQSDTPHAVLLLERDRAYERFETVGGTWENEVVQPTAAETRERIPGARLGQPDVFWIKCILTFHW